VTQRIAVLGAGSWGTTLGNLLAKKGHDVVIWSFEPDVASEINDSSRNSRYLKGITLSGRLSATPSVTDAVQNAGVVVSVTPAQHVRRVMAEASSAIEDDALIVTQSRSTASQARAAALRAVPLSRRRGYAEIVSAAVIVINSPRPSCRTSSSRKNGSSRPPKRDLGRRDPFAIAPSRPRVAL
jgi:predicted dinucleotide-binding enzyme